MPQLPVEVVCWTSLRASPFIAEMVIRYAIMHAASLQYIWQREAYCAPKLWAVGPPLSLHAKMAALQDYFLH